MKGLLLFILIADLCAAAQTSTTTLGEQIAADLTEAKAGTTPAAWLRAHPNEKFQIFNGSQLANDTKDWCARSVLTHTSAVGQVWTRAVYFYDPVPPPDDALPPTGASKQEVLRTTCQFGLMWIQLPETNVSAGTKLVQEIEAALQSRYSTGTVPKLPGGFGSAGWIEKRQWQVGDALLTAAYDDFQGKGTRVLVRLAFPNSDAFHDLTKETEQAHIDLLAQRDDLVRRIKQTELAAGPTAKMIALLEGSDYFSGKNLPSGNQVAEAFADWLTAAKSQSPGQNAIALLAADRVLDFLDHNGVQFNDSHRAQLEALGADYAHDELAGGIVYTHGFLKQAKALAPPGPASDEVLLLLMERGFDMTGACSAGAEEFALVIEQGESLLAGARALPTSTLAPLHFMVGDAYATVVWLAQNNNDGYHDPKHYQPMEESARQKALEQYRAAFTLERGTARSQKTWKEAWRLAIGLPPTTGRYFCIYD